MAFQTQLSIATTGPGLYEFTQDIADWLQRMPAEAPGLLTLFVQHTSCSLLVQENADPEVKTDLKNFFERLVPKSNHPSMSYLTHTYEGPDDMPAHIKAALLPVSLSIPTCQNRLQLGTWQGLYLFEHRTRAHRRTVLAHLQVDP